MKKLTNKDYKLIIGKSEFINIEKYIKSKIPIDHKCKKCNNIESIKPNEVISGKRKCKNCFRDPYKKHEKYLLAIKNYYVQPIDNYIKNNTMITHKCSRCHYIWDTSPKNIKKGGNCPKCSNTRRLSHLDYLQKVPDTIKVLEKYIDYRTTIKHQCNTCGNIWKAQPSNIINLSGCGLCSGKFHGLKFYKNKPTILYNISVNNIFKVGVTLLKNKPVLDKIKDRFRHDINNGVDIVIIDFKIYKDGAEAYRKEQDILKDINKFRYKGPKLLYSGNTELFTESIDLKKYTDSLNNSDLFNIE